MIKPSIDELTKHGKYNRYELVIAVSKCAHMVTNEYVKQREEADKKAANKDNDKTIAAMIDKNLRDEKAVRNAIHMLYYGDYRIDDDSVTKNLG